MEGCVVLVLHAHLPFVRHPEHESFLEENWLFEAITEAYIPLLEMLERWTADSIPAPLTFTLTPTLCAMLQDQLLRRRYEAHLDRLVELAEKELHRTRWERPFNELAAFYRQRLEAARDFYRRCSGDLVGVFRKLQDAGRVEIITSAATHAVLPLLLPHTPSIRGQVLTARDHYRACFGRDPRGVWLPECAYDGRLEPILAEAGLRWFVTDTNGLLHAQPKPRYGTLAPVLTPHGLAAVGRDLTSAKQVWSRNEGYPGDPRYRDFYRDIGFDLEWDYLRPYLPTAEGRTFTGIKYHAITGRNIPKIVYSRQAALDAAAAHADHFLAARTAQIERAAALMRSPPLIIAPYDAELFGHWWYEGPEFIDRFVRQAVSGQKTFSFTTPSEFLRRHPHLQIASPAASSWGEEGYWRMWLDEANQWIYPHLKIAQERMTELARRFASGGGLAPRPGAFGSPRAALPSASPSAPAQLLERGLQQAARELLLAQASDWPFILRTGTSPDYARGRVQSHLLRFTRLYEQLSSTNIDPAGLATIEQTDNLFEQLDWRYWS